MLNNIERNVGSAVDYAQKANSNMVKAKSMRAGVRKVFMYLFIQIHRMHIIYVSLFSTPASLDLLPTVRYLYRERKKWSAFPLPSTCWGVVY